MCAWYRLSTGRLGLICCPAPSQYRTQEPFSFYVNLSDEVDPETFIAEMKRVAEFLSSISDRTTLADARGAPFLDIRLAKLDTEDEFDSERDEEEVEEEFFDFKYRSTLELVMREGRQWYLLLCVDARRQPREDPANRVSIKFERSYHLGVSQ
jgi:hypothetical protein